MKKMNLTLKCVLVMAIISVVSVTLLAIANVYLVPYKAVGLDDKVIAILQNFCPAESYEDISNEYNNTIIDFNEINNANSGKINGIYKAKGQDNDGVLIIESEAKGYDDLVVMLTSFRGEEIKGVAVRSQLESLWTKPNTGIEPNWDKVQSYFIGKTFSDLENVNDLKNPFKTETGATTSRTNNAILTAVALAAKLNSQLNGAFIKPEPTEPQPVTENDLLTKLRSITSQDASFTAYPYSVNKQVKKVYVSNSGEVIFDAVYNEGNYGDCNLLILVDVENKVALKILFISAAYEPYEEENINAAPLFEPENLSKLTGKTSAELDNMGHLDPTTGATESSNGLKICVQHALNNIEPFMSKWRSEEE